MQLYLILALVVAIIAVVFAIQNTAIVTVHFFTWQFSQSLALILLLALAIGALVSLIFSLPAIQSRNWKLSKAKKQISTLQEEKKSLQEQLNYKGERIELLEGELDQKTERIELLKEEKKEIATSLLTDGER